MTKKIIQCSPVGLGRTTALWAQGWHGFNSVACSGHHGLGEDDGAAGPGTAWVDGVAGSRTVWGAHHRGLREDDIVVGLGTASWAWRRRLCGQRCHWLRLGKMAVCKGFDRGRERRCGGSREDLTTTRRFRGGLNDGTGSGEVNDGVGSREIFGGKFCQPDGVSESLRGLGFAKVA
jgi:hypothetical protein